MKEEVKVKEKILLLLIISICASVAISCKSKDTFLRDVQTDIWSLDTSVSYVPIHIDEEDSLQYVKSKGEYLVYSLMDYEGNHTFYFTEGTDYENMEQIFQANCDNIDVIDFAIDGEGNVYFLLIESNGIDERIYVLEREKKGSLIEKSILNDFHNGELDDCYQWKIEVDMLGQMIVYSTWGYWMINSDGCILENENFQEKKEYSIIYIDEYVCIFKIFENVGYVYYKYDFVSEEKKVIKNLPVSSNMLGLYDSENCLLFGTEVGLYLYDFKKDEQELLYRWSDFGVIGESICTLMVCDTKLHCISYSNGELSDISTVGVSSHTKKKELIFGYIGDSAQLRYAVSDYNKSSNDCIIKVIDYLEEYEYGDDVTMTAVNKMYNEILAGKGPDIIGFDTEYVNDYDLAQKGLLAELDGYLSSSDVINKQNMVDSVYNSLLVDDKVYMIPTNFSLETLVSKKEIIGEYDHWSCEKMLDVLSKNSDKELYVDRYDFLEECILLGLSETEDVDMQKMKDYISIAALLPTELVYDPDDSNRKNGRVLFETDNIDSFETFILKKDIWGEDCIFVGYPGVNGEMGIIPENCLAINAKSKYKKEAWDFIEKFFTEEWQGNITPNWKFSTLKDTFTQQVSLEYANSCGWQERYTEQELREKINELNEMIEQATVLRRYHSFMVNIITEEAENVWINERDIDEAVKIIENRVYLLMKE